MSDPVVRRADTETLEHGGLRCTLTIERPADGFSRPPQIALEDVPVGVRNALLAWLMPEGAAPQPVTLAAMSCPGPHRLVVHRDRKAPWCEACGRDAGGNDIVT